jgi:hypothetical protein
MGVKLVPQSAEILLIYSLYPMKRRGQPALTTLRKKEGRKKKKRRTPGNPFFNT